MGNGVERIEPLGPRRPLQPFKRADHTGDGNDRAAGAPGIPPQRIANGGLEEVSADAEGRLFRRRDIRSAVLHAWSRVIDDEALPRAQADLQQQAFAIARLQQVEADAHVRIEKAFAVERAFPRALYACEDDGLHGQAAGSRTTSRAFLSSRSPAKRE